MDFKFNFMGLHRQEIPQFGGFLGDFITSHTNLRPFRPQILRFVGFEMNFIIS